MKLRIKLLLLYPLCLLAGLFILTSMPLFILFDPARAWIQAIACDQGFNASIGGNPDETLSSRANRARIEGRRWGCVLCGVLDLFDANHCPKSAGV